MAARRPLRKSLAAPLAAQLLTLLRETGRHPGDPLSERALAQALNVSRSPVRAALAVLKKRGAVTLRSGGGFAVGRLDVSIKPGRNPDAVYFRLAGDRLDGALPDKVSESDLLRRYDVPRAELARILRRAAAEGWMERLPGHGWMFLPAITAPDAYRESYRFRLALEPAAILEDDFVPDTRSLLARRAQQEALLAGGLKTASDAEIFEMNSGLHETIAACSGNRFFIEALKRINRVRRLMEYRKRLDRADARIRCREHLGLIDLLVAGKRKEAARMMRAHLNSVGAQKSGI